MEKPLPAGSFGRSWESKRRRGSCSPWAGCGGEIPFAASGLLRREVALDALRLQKEEIADAAWVEWDRLMEMVRSREFHHYGDVYFHYIHRKIYTGTTEESD